MVLNQFIFNVYKLYSYYSYYFLSKYHQEVVVLVDLNRTDCGIERLRLFYLHVVE